MSERPPFNQIFGQAVQHGQGEQQALKEQLRKAEQSGNATLAAAIQQEFDAVGHVLSDLKELDAMLNPKKGA